ncbi:cobyrinic acid a,c-diamide synthase,Cobyrinic acid A,C-diamide synthase,cobyrinic acid a,c-diamide synthase,Predicted glutamine amidotransferase,cobyrinic acid a,c-diamide synthase,CobB/CobQ-like glutamine amidotransferase domain [[Clostridium] sordellii]|uniref:cobyrinate a,c-diamide synthase n=1 Tax=Paraclostridium sordellii TaxID=1505 RepID=UPI00054414A7|nr:cobyrinate a,c-diamide synthase [Paeniclostridium sordellii]CEK34410.1 cobyrinic acid a,c-diamide synthase,Cobyrinic acid A,C-diamide synthase,cobyrinic acid a,c-diamide synthase,Predicted glutamine amidotransferase,cobyrinic acid a,c-diamide synthase,CobB/CobQ-like glutamine amidotransferase domain [[Clostridium] sordellii] [Paeniclostridium sordellii]
MKKILIAGTNSGVGKTTISLGIMQALTKRNLKVQPYKVGPDYIDPSYHTFITGRDSRNLDSYMLDDEKIKYIFKNASKDADISVIEGVMGLYDGFGIDLNSCTSSYTSKILKSPVILVINGKAMSSSAAAMVLGYKELDKEVNIKGVIVNNVKTKNHYELIKEAIEKYCNVEVLGYFPPNEKFKLDSRHLGLVPSVEIEALTEKFYDLGSEIEKYINIDRLIEISESEEIETSFELNELPKFKNKSIAVAYDKAFNFYYKENLELLNQMNIEIKTFSPLYDEIVPKADCIYIGGGFPEVFAKELGINKKMRESIKKAHENNVPIYAECGGLMYLGEKLLDLDGNEYEMVGIFEGISKMTKSLKRFGYCDGIAKVDTVFSNKGDIIKGHEFHHSEFNSNEECSYKMVKKRGNKIVDEWYGGYSKGNTLATYLHTHFYNNLDSIIKFVGGKDE